VVLEKVDLSLMPGESMALLGPNGAGKTTLLKILATLIRPSNGTARVGGYDVTRQVEQARLAIGLLAHGNYLYEDLTAMENLRFWATLANTPADKDHLRNALVQVELEPVSDERVRNFSSGMKRRLALARLLLSSPRVLLLDEPFAALDQRGKKWLEEFLLAFKTKGGTVLLATHSFGTGLGIADRVAILVGGQIVLDRAMATLSREELHRLYTFHTEDAR
jgi:heme ABC exporter ATP-binding subunit CcmA